MAEPIRARIRIEQRTVGGGVWFSHTGTWRGIPHRWNAPTLERLFAMLRADKVIL